MNVAVRAVRLARRTLVLVRPRLAGEAADRVVVPLGHRVHQGRLVLVGPPALLGHRQVRLVLPAAVAGREAVPAGAATPAAGPSDVEEW